MKRTYGRLWLEDRLWKVETEPHVVLRAKRVFQQLVKGRSDQLVMSDTLETSRDLAWFMERYPLDMTPVDRKHLERQSDAHVDRESYVDRILSGLVKLDDVETALPAREYQKQAIQLLLANRGLLLADDMGLGKTVSAIGAMTYAHMRPCVVVTLTALPKQWEAEIKRFAPKLTTHIVKKGQPYDITGAKKKRHGQLTIPGNVPDVTIISYSKLAAWGQTLGSFAKFVVFDEVQEFRHGVSTNKGVAGNELARNVEYRLGLSGTPIYGLGAEMWHVMQFIAPDLLGKWDEFLREWCGAVNQQGKASLKNPKAFGAFLRDSGFLLRRNKQDVGLETPDCVRVIHGVDSDAEPLKNIEQAAHNLAQVILSRVEGTTFDRMQASAQMDLMVRQATGVSKAPYCAEFVKMLLENGESVLLFAWHREVYDVLENRLKKYSPRFYTGTESVAQKNASVDAFVSGESKLLIMSLRSGAGIDGLQKVCRTVVFAELDWSPAVMEQNICRIDRPGQEQLVNVFFLVSDEGSDPPMSDVLQLKRAQVEGIREPTKDVIVNQETDGNRIKELARRYLDSRKAKTQLSPLI